MSSVSFLSIWFGNSFYVCVICLRIGKIMLRKMQGGFFVGNFFFKSSAVQKIKDEKIKANRSGGNKSAEKRKFWTLVDEVIIKYRLAIYGKIRLTQLRKLLAVGAFHNINNWQSRGLFVDYLRQTPFWLHFGRKIKPQNFCKFSNALKNARWN